MITLKEWRQLTITQLERALWHILDRSERGCPDVNDKRHMKSIKKLLAEPRLK